MTTQPWFVLIACALIAAAGAWVGLLIANWLKRKERADDITAAAEAKLAEVGERIISRSDEQAKAFEARLKECWESKAVLYKENLDLRGELAESKRNCRQLEADWSETKAELNDAGARYLFLESAVDTAGYVLSPRGKLVKKTDSGEVKTV